MVSMLDCSEWESVHREYTRILFRLTIKVRLVALSSSKILVPPCLVCLHPKLVGEKVKCQTSGPAARLAGFIHPLYVLIYVPHDLFVHT
jgi:hypothetical protein